MGRVLILLLLALLVVWWVFGRAARLRDAPPGGRKRRGEPASQIQDIVACAHCGVHVPRSEAVSDGVDHYCGEPHRLLGRQP
jgi:uncharacterized protein